MAGGADRLIVNASSGSIQTPSLVLDNSVTNQNVMVKADGTLVKADAPIKYVIGDIVNGGIVFYVDQTGQNGLVVFDSDVGDYTWNRYTNQYFFTNARCRNIGCGDQNTAQIMAVVTSTGTLGGVHNNFAARAAAQKYTPGEFGNWYLPNVEEMELIKTNLHDTGIHTYANKEYWSSRETNAAEARTYNIANDTSSDEDKNDIYSVLAVKKF